MPLERIGERAMLEPVRQVEPALVARVGVEIGEHLVHAAVLGVEHLLNLRVAERREHALGPLGELDLDVERGAVAGVAIRVAQPGERLVQRVPGRPQAVQVEAARADVALGHRGPTLRGRLERARGSRRRSCPAPPSSRARDSRRAS